MPKKSLALPKVPPPAGEAMTDRPDYLNRVTFTRRSSLRLTFPDRTFTLAIKRLDMPIDQFRWETAAASPAGNAMMVTAKDGEIIPIDSSVLRYLVDAEYASRVDAELKSRQFSHNELKEIARGSKPPAGF